MIDPQERQAARKYRDTLSNVPDDKYDAIALNASKTYAKEMGLDPDKYTDVLNETMYGFDEHAPAEEPYVRAINLSYDPDMSAQKLAEQTHQDMKPMDLSSVFDNVNNPEAHNMGPQNPNKVNSRVQDGHSNEPTQPDFSFKARSAAHRLHNVIDNYAANDPANDEAYDDFFKKLDLDPKEFQNVAQSIYNDKSGVPSNKKDYVQAYALIENPDLSDAELDQTTNSLMDPNYQPTEPSKPLSFVEKARSAATQYRRTLDNPAIAYEDKSDAKMDYANALGLDANHYQRVSDKATFGTGILSHDDKLYLQAHVLADNPDLSNDEVKTKADSYVDPMFKDDPATGLDNVTNPIDKKPIDQFNNELNQHFIVTDQERRAARKRQQVTRSVADDDPRYMAADMQYATDMGLDPETYARVVGENASHPDHLAPEEALYARAIRLADNPDISPSKLFAQTNQQVLPKVDTNLANDDIYPKDNFVSESLDDLPNFPPESLAELDPDLNITDDERYLSKVFHDQVANSVDNQFDKIETDYARSMHLNPSKLASVRKDLENGQTVDDPNQSRYVKAYVLGKNPDISLDDFQNQMNADTFPQALLDNERETSDAFNSGAFDDDLDKMELGLDTTSLDIVTNPKAKSDAIVPPMSSTDQTSEHHSAKSDSLNNALDQAISDIDRSAPERETHKNDYDKHHDGPGK